MTAGSATSINEAHRNQGFWLYILFLNLPHENAIRPYPPCVRLVVALNFKKK